MRRQCGRMRSGDLRVWQDAPCTCASNDQRSLHTCIQRPRQHVERWINYPFSLITFQKISIDHFREKVETQRQVPPSDSKFQTREICKRPQQRYSQIGSFFLRKYIKPNGQAVYEKSDVRRFEFMLLLCESHNRMWGTIQILNWTKFHGVNMPVVLFFLRSTPQRLIFHNKQNAVCLSVRASI